jgi:hypothetical protein
MSVLPVGMAGASGSYSITNSIRLNGTSDYLSKTLTTGATTSGSVWVKRSKLGATSPIFDNKVYFTSGDALYAFGLTSTALYRDPSAWLHIFWNGTGVYVNGTLVTGSGTYTAASVTNPRLGYDGTNYFSGYLSDFAFWNGTSASLQGGATNADGVWAAKRPSAGYSFLTFGSSGALGTDTSGNGNTWTVNGSPVQTTDTPTNNYCTWNPLNPAPLHVLTNGARTLTNSSPSTATTYGTVPLPEKWYVEIRCDTYTGSAGFCGWGIGDPDTGKQWVYGDGGNVNTDGSGSYSSTGTTTTATDVFMFAGDRATGKWWAGKNNTWFLSGNPATGANPLSTNLTTASAVITFYTGYGTSAGRSIALTMNAGQVTNAYAPPTGFNALCTANLPSVAVTTSGTFTGNANADGPFVWTNGNPATLTINGNAVTFGTHADKTAGGFKLRTSSASYNTSGSNTWTATAGKRFVYSATSINTAQGNP